MATKPVSELVVGDVLPGEPRVVTKVETTATSVTVTFADGTTQSWSLAGDPSVEVTGG